MTIFTYCKYFIYYSFILTLLLNIYHNNLFNIPFYYCSLLCVIAIYFVYSSKLFYLMFLYIIAQHCYCNLFYLSFQVILFNVPLYYCSLLFIIAIYFIYCSKLFDLILLLIIIGVYFIYLFNLIYLMFLYTITYYYYYYYYYFIFI